MPLECVVTYGPVFDSGCANTNILIFPGGQKPQNGRIKWMATLLESVITIERDGQSTRRNSTPLRFFCSCTDRNWKSTRGPRTQMRFLFRSGPAIECRVKWASVMAGGFTPGHGSTRGNHCENGRFQRVLQVTRRVI